MQELLHEYPEGDAILRRARARPISRTGSSRNRRPYWRKRLDLFPRNVPVTIRLAETLMRAGDNKRAQLILDDLFNQVEPTPDQAKLIAKAANAAGNMADSYYYMADYYLMNGDL